MKRKSLIITEEAHTRLKNYCKKNSLKLNQWAEMILLKYLEKESGNLQNNK